MFLASAECTAAARAELETTVALTLQQTAWMQSMAAELSALRSERPSETAVRGLRSLAGGTDAVFYDDITAARAWLEKVTP